MVKAIYIILKPWYCNTRFFMVLQSLEKLHLMINRLKETNSAQQNFVIGEVFMWSQIAGLLKSMSNVVYFKTSHQRGLKVCSLSLFKLNVYYNVWLVGLLFFVAAQFRSVQKELFFIKTVFLNNQFGFGLGLNRVIFFILV